jgi:acyl carrier protein
MTREEFTAEFSKILSIDPHEIGPETKLQDILAWDSVAYLNVMVLIDENFGIAVKPEVFSQVECFADILKLLEGKI